MAFKQESIQEFLARGGQVTRVPPKERDVVVQPMNPTNVGPAVLLTYGEADLYYGEVRARKSKKGKLPPKINFADLPEALRKKYSKELLNGQEV